MADLKDLTQPEPRPGRKPEPDAGPELEPHLGATFAIPAGPEPEGRPVPEPEPPIVNTVGEDVPEGFPRGLEFEPMMSAKPPKKPGLRLLGVFGGLIVLGAVAGWYFLGDSFGDAGSGKVPLVEAQEGPIKVKPDAPGGMEVPNRDKLVYNRLRSGDVEPRVEHLLPPPEEPLERPVPDAAVPSASEVGAAELPEQPAIASALDEPAPESKIESLPDPVAVVSPPSEATPPTVEPAPEATPKSETPASDLVIARKPEPSVAPKPAIDPAKAYKVQLAAARTRSLAKSEFKRLQKAHPDLLGNLELSVMRVDLGKKGIFYRVRVGPFADEAAARKLCADLKARKQACLPVKPSRE